jgi:hypothetical protein
MDSVWYSAVGTVNKSVEVSVWYSAVSTLKKSVEVSVEGSAREYFQTNSDIIKQ